MGKVVASLSHRFNPDGWPDHVDELLQHANYYLEFLLHFYKSKLEK